MGSTKKQNVSVRMSRSDLKKIKEIAKRLQVRESDVFRFAVRSSLAKLTPLHDSEIAGKGLVAVFIEHGSELTSFFELDSEKLDAIINGGVEDPINKVEKTDIDLMVMSGLQENYLTMRLQELITGDNEGMTATALLRQYLVKKYFQMGDDEMNTVKNTA